MYRKSIAAKRGGVDICEALIGFTNTTTSPGRCGLCEGEVVGID